MANGINSSRQATHESWREPILKGEMIAVNIYAEARMSVHRGWKLHLAKECTKRFFIRSVFFKTMEPTAWTGEWENTAILTRF